MKNLRITTDGQIFIANQCIGFIDDEIVYVFVCGNAVKLGSIDHRSEVAQMVSDWQDAGAHENGNT